MPDIITPPSNAPPDWETRTKDLPCPLCGYNLRGLTEGRCPECGFAFTWQEVLDAEKNKHPYLFEYGNGKNVSSFWKTYWTTCRPRRFWRDVNPAQEVRLVRLLLYWILASSLIFSLLGGAYVKPVCTGLYETFTLRACFKPLPSDPKYLRATGKALAAFGPAVITKDELDYSLPPPWHSAFWEELASESFGQYGYSDRLRTVALEWGIIFLLWPWLTLLSLMVFRFSMRSAKIRSAHLIRTVIYSCDYGLLMVAVTGMLLGLGLCDDYAQGWAVLMMAAAFAIVTGYRLTIAFNRYLRVHRPLATVLASQLISFLIVFVAMVPIADFSRRV